MKHAMSVKTSMHKRTDENPSKGGIARYVHGHIPKYNTAQSTDIKKSEPIKVPHRNK